LKSKPATSSRLPDFVEPMKAKLVDSMPAGDWIYEIKFDGYRAVALRGGGLEYNPDHPLSGGSGLPLVPVLT
jgi:ATP-dependent DNA ligase